MSPAGHAGGHTHWLNGMPVSWARAGEVYHVCMECQWDGYLAIDAPCERCGAPQEEDDDDDDDD